MRLKFQLLTAFFAVSYVRGAPHHDGSGDDHTHSPIVAPDSESVINVEGHKMGDQHHSDVYLGSYSKSNLTELAAKEDTEVPDDGSAVHHSDTYMLKEGKSGESQRLKANTHVEPQTTTSAAILSTSKPKAVHEQPGSGHPPVAPINHAVSNKNEGSPLSKSIVAHAPVTLGSDSSSKLSGGGKHHSSSRIYSGSVVAHGPMAKNVEDHEKRYDHQESGHLDRPSSVQHAPMATEHHPSKSNHASNPSHSKTDPGGSGAHSPLVRYHAMDDKTKHDKPLKESIDERLEVEPAVKEGQQHAPMATEHQAAKVHLAHHPALSKTDGPSPVSGSHPPVTNAESHDEHKGSEIHVEKRSEPHADVKTTTNSSLDDSSSHIPLKIPIVHHPSLSKTEPALPIIKTNQEPVKQFEESVTPTTENIGNSLDTSHNNPGLHQLVKSDSATVGPTS